MHTHWSHDGCLGWLLPVLALLSCNVSAGARTLPAETPHPVGIECAGCHQAQDPPATAAGRLVARQETLCGGCHAGAVRVSHPSGFRPDRELPASLPLDARGELSCSTCHDVHARPGERRRQEPAGAGFCTSCHSPVFFDGMRDGGLSLLRSAHLEAGREPDPVLPDPYSVQCMACHEEMLETAGGPRHRVAAPGHPTGVEYARAVGFGGYREPRLLDASIILPAGRVSCVSCHSGYGRDHGALLQVRGGLCAQCHDL